MNRYLPVRRARPMPVGSFGTRSMKKVVKRYKSLSPSQKEFIRVGAGKLLRRGTNAVLDRISRRRGGPRPSPGTGAPLRNVEFISNDTGAEITYSRFFSRKYKQPRAYTRIARRVISEDNTFTEVNSINERGYRSLACCDGEDLGKLLAALDDKTLSGTNFNSRQFSPTPTSQFPDTKYLVSAYKARLQLTNLSNSSISVKIHIVACKRDCSRGTYEDNNTTPVSLNGRFGIPERAYEQGMFCRSIDEQYSVFTGRAAPRVNVSFMQSHYFNRYYGIIKTFAINLTPGQSHVHNYYRTINYNINFLDLYLNRNGTLTDQTLLQFDRFQKNIAGLTQYILVEHTPNAALATGTSTLGIPACTLGFTYNFSIMGKKAEDSREPYFTRPSNLATGTYVGTNPDTGATGETKASTS